MERAVATKRRASNVVSATLGLLALGSAAWAHEGEQDSVVRWQTIVGVITAPGVNNPVSNINSGGAPWSVRDGDAQVNLANGATSFDVDGLVLNGTAASGTPGPVTAVVGSLVCNAGTATQAVVDTAPVALNARGKAEFRGRLALVPSPCGNPLFLIRVAAPAGAAGRWIATGAIRVFGDDDDDDD
jgi:hypothetical protein